METKTTAPIMLYTEQTPNPDSLKFVTNRMLYKGTADFRTEELAKEWSPLAAELFKFHFVNGVYICNNYVTISKEMNYLWEDITMKTKEFIKGYVAEDRPILNNGFEEAMAKIEEERGVAYHYEGDEAKLVQKIKALLDKYVKPAVEMDGGNIEFKAYDKGKVIVVMQGSCSGCPSSTVTLKSGIEGMLKRMVPEVTEVVAEMG